MTDSSKFCIAQNAYNAFNQYVVQSQGQHVDYLVPVEVGALNSLMPMLVSAQTGIPVILSDSMGRAVPTLTMTSYSANGISTNPSILSNANTPADSVAILLDSASAVEALARPIISSSEFNSVAGLALWKMTGQQCKNYSVPGGIPIALAAGYMSKLASTSENPLATLQESLKYGKVVVVGSFKQQIVTSGGFDLGSVTIIDNTNPNNQVVVYNQNENLFVYSSLQSSPLLTGPDVIAYIRVKDGTFLSNADLQDSTVIGADEEIALMLLPVHSMIFNNETIRGVVNQLMKPLGYAGPIVTVFTEEERAEYFAYMTEYGMNLLAQN
ncbi:predicted protein [Naegleria gruberi]|uniref:Predicted protein n=1 Tax=Naegleria gruberi TaxID=5762 RepID=D2W2K4_NAEGR|nr:uncharacterized protein NAEGRDRAFT_54207 [Naegleria gruberi]EFC36761.1 predicted protein [Naegleria gruberi]|eukprot:XP_002669505.1 predicted protein [Naegleria gruberi strain NEG-M]